MAGGPVQCYRYGCRVGCRAWRQCPSKGCGVDIAACADHGGDPAAIAAMTAHIAAVHQPPIDPHRWTGPAPGDLEDAGLTWLVSPVPPERWPYGPPGHHQVGCGLFRAGLFCDCAASAADDTEHGEGAWPTVT
jgi:hypothetical protein